jgi:hypothetical protein
MSAKQTKKTFQFSKRFLYCKNFTVGGCLMFNATACHSDVQSTADLKVGFFVLFLLL